MKIEITKSFTGIIDTDYEHRRIAKNFKGETARKLNQLLKAIENLDFEKACKMLESDWWQGRDKKDECPRLEYIGYVFSPLETPDGFSNNTSYIDLVYAIINYKENYKLRKV